MLPLKIILVLIELSCAYRLPRRWEGAMPFSIYRHNLNEQESHLQRLKTILSLRQNKLRKAMEQDVREGRRETWAKRIFDREEQRLEQLKQEVIDAENKIQDFPKNTSILIFPEVFDDESDGFGFKVQYQSDVLAIFFLHSFITDVGYLRITGPNDFELGFKWKSTKNFDGRTARTTCTKQTRSELSEIFELIDGVEIKSWYDFTKEKRYYIEGGVHDDSCMPKMAYKLETDEKFDPKVFQGLGMKLNDKEIEKIENAEAKFKKNCKVNC